MFTSNAVKSSFEIRRKVLGTRLNDGAQHWYVDGALASTGALGGHDVHHVGRTAQGTVITVDAPADPQAAVVGF